ncbi:MAG: thiamine phosphate synthase [Candidatus Omnitrophota bacterium]
MSWRKRQLKNSRLYVLLDSDICSRRLIEIAKQAIKAGADIIQLRLKDGSVKDRLRYAQILRRLTKGKSLFVVNDYIDVALASKADGVHLGQHDMPIEITRKILGKKILIGISCHSLKQAKEAQRKGADYIGIGPIFSTPAKPKAKAIGLKVLRRVKKNIRIPFFAIGGIDQKNIRQISDCGAKRVAVVRAVCKSNNINRTIKRFKILLN